MEGWIHVTQKDIDLGQRGDTRCCPIALATRRRVGSESSFWYGWRGTSDGRVVYVVNGHKERVNEWVERFDGGRRVKPIRFPFRMKTDG